MEGIFIRRNTENLGKVSKRGEELCLMAQGDGTEIMTQRVKPGIVISVAPGNDKELMEFFYIISGTVSYEGNDGNVILKDGDYFYAHRLSGIAYFKTVTEVTLMYVSTQPVFKLLSEEINEINVIMKKFEQPDTFTNDREKRLCDYAVGIGQKLGLDKEAQEALFYAALFHDFGKIDMTKEGMNGTLELSESEMFKRMSENKDSSFDKSFLQRVVIIISQHHERLDGTGYPNRLKGDNICIEARIIAVVDAFDSVTTDSPYKKALSPLMAIEELKRLTKSHYDENVIKKFEIILKEEKRI